MVRFDSIIPPDKRFNASGSINAIHTFIIISAVGSPNSFSCRSKAHNSVFQSQAVMMGDAVDPPAATHFGQDNVEAAGPVIDLVAEDDLPPAESLKNDDDWVYPFPTDFKIQEKTIDDVRPLKVGITTKHLSGRHC
jgi:hypothetical protein